VLSTAGEDAMPSLAEADTVIASSARPIKAIRLIQCPPVRVIATSGTSSLWNVCSDAHEVNSKGAFEPPSSVICRSGSAGRSREAVHYAGMHGDAAHGASLWYFREK
jgi:hypothetical protein